MTFLFPEGTDHYFHYFTLLISLARLVDKIQTLKE